MYPNNRTVPKCNYMSIFIRFRNGEYWLLGGDFLLFGCCWLWLIGCIVCVVISAAIFSDISALGDDGICRIVAADVNVENGLIDGDDKSDNQA